MRSRWPLRRRATLPEGRRRLDGERRPAPARRLGVRVLDGETAARQVVDEIHFGALEVADADGSTNSRTPLDSTIRSTSAVGSPSSIIRPYWKPEQPPPCTNTRRPALALPSSESNSLIFSAATEVTLIMAIEDSSRPDGSIATGPRLRQPPGRSGPAWQPPRPTLMPDRFASVVPRRCSAADPDRRRGPLAF